MSDKIEMSGEPCTECVSKNTCQYMDPIERSDGMHYYFLCEDSKNEWEITKK
jgi:hypothetical protein